MSTENRRWHAQDMATRRRLASLSEHLSRSAAGRATPVEEAAVSVAISEYGTSPNADPLMRDFEKYGIMSNVVELEAYGMTVVPPEKLNWKPDFADRLKYAIVRTCERRNDMVIGDPDTTQIRGKEAAKMGENSWDLIEEDPVFVEAATNPVQLALVRWLLGQSAVFGGQTWIMKRPSKRTPGVTQAMGLHSDSHGLPPGSGAIAHMCNASILATDYISSEDGPTVFVPGRCAQQNHATRQANLLTCLHACSHKFGRATLPHETMSLGDDSGFKTFPLIGKKGSLALWNGAVWHASLPRYKPGLRVTLVQNYFRTYMRPQAVRLPLVLLFSAVSNSFAQR